MIKRIAAGIVFVASLAFAQPQPGQGLVPVGVAPSGPCSSNFAQLVGPGGVIYTCQNGTWGSSGGGGTIPSTTLTLRGDGAGNAAAVTGTGTNCVHVDGSSASCSGAAGAPVIYCVGSASATATTCPGVPSGAASYTAMTGSFIAGATSIGAPLTLNVNALGARNVYLNGTATSATNFVVSGQVYSFTYDGTQIQLSQPSTFPGPITSGGNPPAVTGSGIIAMGETTGQACVANADCIIADSVSHRVHVYNNGTTDGGAVVGASTTDTLTNKSIAATEVNSGTLAAAQMPALTGDCTTSAGTVSTTCTKTSGVTFGTAATVNTGTSGAVIPLLNGNNAYSGTSTFTGKVDASGATHTLPALTGLAASKPATCTVGEMYFASDATAGQNWYYCTATNTWTQQLNSGGGGGVSSAAWASRPACSTSVFLFQPTDGAGLTSLCNGSSSYLDYFASVPITRPAAAASFTTVNSATLTDTTGTVTISKATSGLGVSLLAIPTGNGEGQQNGTWTITAGIEPGIWGNYHECGLALTNGTVAGTSAALLLQITVQTATLTWPEYISRQYNPINGALAGGTVAGIPVIPQGPLLFLRAQKLTSGATNTVTWSFGRSDDGTIVAPDNIRWIQIGTDVPSSQPTNYGIGLDPRGTLPAACRLVSLSLN